MDICACFQSLDLQINYFKSNYYGEICRIDPRNSKFDNQNLKKLRSNRRKIKKNTVKLSLGILGEKKTLIKKI